MVHKKTAKTINALVGIVLLTLLAFFIIGILNPLLYFSDKSRWYGEAASKLPTYHDYRYLFSLRAIEEDPHNEQAQYIHFLYQAFQLGVPNIDAKILDYQDSNSIPHTSLSLGSLAILYIQECQQSKAQEIISKGMQDFPRVQSFYLYGAILSMQKGDPNEARILSKKGLSIRPEDESYRTRWISASLYTLDGLLSQNKERLKGKEFSPYHVFWMTNAIDGCKHAKVNSSLSLQNP
jgi:tetratricopeptide (TPR) repeat protein